MGKINKKPEVGDKVLVKCWKPNKPVDCFFTEIVKIREPGDYYGPIVIEWNNHKYWWIHESVKNTCRNSHMGYIVKNYGKD